MWIERAQLLASVVLQVAIVAVLSAAIVQARWLVVFTASIVLLLTFVPAVLERRLRLYLPVELTFANCVFLYAAFVLGELRDFYEIYWWWDLMLHGFSALSLGIIGFLLVYVFHMTQRVEIGPFFLAMFTLGFTVTLGALWEIFEYLMDIGFHLNMQKSGLQDTMTDLMVDFLGALVAATLGYLYVKDGDSVIVDRLVRKIFALNPRLRRKSKGGPPATPVGPAS